MAVTSQPNPRTIRVFVSSADDVAEERKVVDSICKTISASGLAERLAVRLEAFLWEIKVASKIGDPPQEVVDGQTPDYQIYCGIAWCRFGDGTEREFRRALARYEGSGAPWIMFFVRVSDVPLKLHEDASASVRRLKRLKNYLKERGLVTEYESVDDFREKVRGHLERAASVLAYSSAPTPTGSEFEHNLRHVAENFVRDFPRHSRTHARYVQLAARNQHENAVGSLHTLVDQVTLDWSQNVAVLGDFGTGKTTFCSNYAYAKAKQWLNEPDPCCFPVYLRLGNYPATEAPDMLDWCRKLFAERTGTRVDQASFLRWQDARRLLFILDGLDEMPGGVGESTIHSCLTQFKKLLQGASPVVFTSRAIFYETHAAHILPDTKRFFIDALNEQQRAELVRLYRRGSGWEDLLQNRQDILMLTDLARRPLFLAMMCEHETLLGDNIRDIVDLYLAMAEQWIRHEDERQRDVNRLELLHFIREAAYVMFLAENQVLSKEQMSQLAAKLDADPEKQEQLVEAARGAAFLRTGHQGDVRFAHPTFVDFFVAQKAVAELTQNDCQSLGERLLYEEIFDFIGVLASRMDDCAGLREALCHSNDFIVRVNAIPPLRKCRDLEAAPLLLERALHDEHPLVRYLSSYTTAVFWEDAGYDVASVSLEAIERARSRERNKLVKNRLEYLLLAARDRTQPSIDRRWVWDSESINEITQADGVVSAYLRILVVNREHAIVIEEAIRLLAASYRVRRDKHIRNLLTTYMFRAGAAHGDGRVRAAVCWAIKTLQLIQSPGPLAERALETIGRLQRDPNRQVRAVAEESL